MDFQQIAQHLASISGISATCFDGDEILFQLPQSVYLKRFLSYIPSEPARIAGNVKFVMTDDLLCYGSIQIHKTDCRIILGPIAIIACDNRRAQRILRKIGLPTTEAGQLISYFQNMPVYSLGRFANFIVFANYVYNHEVIKLEDLLPDEYAYSEETLPKTEIRLDSISQHNAQDFENMMYSMVRYGQYEKMVSFLSSFSFTGSEGSLAGDLSRHRRNLIICSTAIAARNAVEGGVDYETAMSLADSYIQQVEMASDNQKLRSLHDNMLKTYTKMVHDKKANNADSAIASKAHSYIDRHLTEPITVQNIADEIGTSRAYLSSQFKKETGINLNDFINQLKVDESRRLLLTTDLSITEIANQLAFSSQSYFHTIFKRYTGKTPGEFRCS